MTTDWLAAGRPGRPGRLRDVSRGRGRPRRGAVPRRRSRASSWPTARPACSTTTRTRRRRSARRSWPARRGRRRPRRRDPPRRRARRRRLRRRDRPPRRGARPGNDRSRPLTDAVPSPQADRRSRRRSRRRRRARHTSGRSGACGRTVGGGARARRQAGPWAWLLVVVLVAVIAVTGLLVWVTARALPADERDGQRSRACRRPVTVVRDATGIAHITADTTHDLFVAQGYVHASERMWQMEVWRHISAGRLAELFGQGQLDTDQFIRTLGWRVAAQRDLDAVGPEARAVLDAYTEGVNAWLDGHRGSLGLAFLARPASTPEPWTKLDTVAWGKVQAWNLGGNFDSEVFRYLADAALGDPARTDELFPPYREDAPVITPTGPAGLRRRGRGRDRRRPGPTGADRPPAATPRPIGPGRGGRLALDRRPRPGAPPRPPASTQPTASPRTTASARTTGSSARRCRRPAAPCSPTTRTSASRCRRSGTSTASIADRSRPPARTTSPASRSRACPASSSATTRASRGARPTSIPTSRTSSSRPSTRPTRAPTSTTGHRPRSRSATSRSRSPAPSRSTWRSARPSTARSSTTSTSGCRRATDGASAGRRRSKPDRTLEAILGLNIAANFEDFRASLCAVRRPGAELRLRRRRRPHRLPVPGLRADPLGPRRPRRSPGPWRRRQRRVDRPHPVRRPALAVRSGGRPDRDAPTTRRSTADYPYFVAQEWDPGFRAERIVEQIDLYGADGLTVEEMGQDPERRRTARSARHRPVARRGRRRRPTTAPRSPPGSRRGTVRATGAASAARRGMRGSTACMRDIFDDDLGTLARDYVGSPFSWVLLAPAPRRPDVAVVGRHGDAGRHRDLAT